MSRSIFHALAMERPRNSILVLDSLQWSRENATCVEASKLNISPKTVEFAICISVVCGSNGNSLEFTGTTVSPFQETVFDTDDIQWSDSSQASPSSGLKTVKVDPKFDNHRSYTTRLELRKPKYSALQSCGIWASSLHFKSVSDEVRKQGPLSAFAGTGKSLLEPKVPVDLGEPEKPSGRCIPLILHWGGNF